jgi:hypothetical protein
MCAIALGIVTAPAHALEVWLASTESCNSCAIYERAAQARGYGFALRYPDRGGLTIPILKIDKNVLAADVVGQLPEDLGPRSPYWDVTLLVLVMDADRVVTAGNIAESADNNELRQPRAVMFPPDAPADDGCALRTSIRNSSRVGGTSSISSTSPSARGRSARPRAPSISQTPRPRRSASAT